MMSSAARTPIVPRQPLAPARAGEDPQLDLGQAELGLGVIGRHAPVAGQRQLQAAAETGAVDRGDDRLGEVLHPVHHLLAVPAQRLGLGLGRERG